MWLLAVSLGAFIAIEKYGNMMYGILFGSYVILNINLIAIAGTIDDRRRGKQESL